MFNKLNNKKGFTFFEVMVAVVILAVGIVGIYRAFLISLKYQKYLLTRLHIVNFLSSQFARFENDVISGKQISFQKEVSQIDVPVDRRSNVSLESISEDVFDRQNGPSILKVKLLWDQGGKVQTFRRSSFVYVED